jgi:hypothetical protein
MNQLVRAHIEIEQRLQAASSAQIASVWWQLGSWRDEDVERFLSRAMPITKAAQRQSVIATNAYVAAYLKQAPKGVPVEKVLSNVRNGVPSEEVYARPFKTLWTRLGNSETFESAMAAAMQQLNASATMDPQLAMRETADWLDRNDTGFYGYTRVADPGACAFCLEVDGAYVKADEGFVMALHNGCGCGLEPNEDPHEGAVFLPDGTEIRDYQYGPLNDNVAVREHSELGPMLADPNHQFTSLN